MSELNEGQRLALALACPISGGLLTYNSATAVDVSALTGFVNYKVLSVAAATYTVNSNTKNLAGATITAWDASSAYFVYFFDNAGTGEIRFEKRTGTGDGQDPTFDSTLSYWKAVQVNGVAGDGAKARRIAKFWTNGSGQIHQFVTCRAGFRQREYMLTTRAANRVVNAGSTTTYTSITLTPYFTADDEFMLLGLQGERTGTTGQIHIFLSYDGTNDLLYLRQSDAVATSGINFLELGAPSRIKYTGALHYKNATSNSSYVDFLGFQQFV